MNKYLIIGLFLVLTSCGKDHALREVTLFIADENRNWITPDKYGSGFIMVDNNRISQGFMMDLNSSDFSPLTTSCFGIRTRITKTESLTQAWSSNFGQRLVLILTAGSEPYGDRFSISISDLSFMYDFKLNTIGRISFKSVNKSKTITDTGYVENETIYSAVQILDSLTVNGVRFNGVLHFSFEDFRDLWTDFTVKEVYLAKESGLIKYSLKNGISYER